MKTIMKTLFLLVALTFAVPVFAQSDFESTKARAEAGDAQSQYDLGLMYANGTGVAQNYEQAVRWFQLAAEKGFARAQYLLGAIFSDGEGVAINYQEALKWLRLAAEQGDADAEYRLGLMYESGKGVAQNYQKAVLWYRSAEQDHAGAKLKIALMYANGRGGERNDQESLRLYSLLKGMPGALVLKYTQGGDVDYDMSEIATWLRLAAMHGETDAQYNLGFMYEMGIGLVQNNSQAYAWYSISAAQGATDAATARDRIRAKLSPQVLEQAQAQATRCFVSNFKDCGE
jgi:TPR repeat protein